MDSPTYRSLRLNLLLVSAAQGMIFWYAIRSLYYLDSGLTVQDIALLGMFAEGSKILFELPTSVFADRWSRKGSLIASNIAMIISSVIIGMSSSLSWFALGLVAWGLHDALRTGVYEAFVYDSLKAQGLQGKFRKVYTRMVSMEFGILAGVGLFAGWLGNVTSLQVSYFLTVVPMLLAIIVLWRMPEPPISRTSSHGENALSHLKGATKLLSHPLLKWVVVLNAALLGLIYFSYEYYQLIGIEIGLPYALFGLQIAAVTIGVSIGAEVAHRFPGHKKAIAFAWVGIALSLLIGLRSSNYVVALLTIFGIFAFTRMLRVYLEVYIHDRIPSGRRATIFSLAGTLSYFWFFAFAGVFTALLNYFSTRTAITLIALPLVLLGLVDAVRGVKWSTDKTAPLELAEPEHVVE